MEDSREDIVCLCVVGGEYRRNFGYADIPP